MIDQIDMWLPHVIAKVGDEELALLLGLSIKLESRKIKGNPY
jgi:hypothetical protein